MADSGAGAGAILSAYLLGSRLFDSVTLEYLNSLFPAKFREHPDIKVAHTQIRRKRARLRKEVQRSIAGYTRDEQERRRRATPGPPAFSEDSAVQTTATAVAELKATQTDIEAELKRVTEENAAMVEEITSMETRAAEARMADLLPLHAINLRRCQAALDSVREQAG